MLMLLCSADAQEAPLEPFSSASSNPLSNAVVATRSGLLASSAPAPRAVFSFNAVAGQAMLFDLQGSGAGQFRITIENPEGVRLRQYTLGDDDVESAHLFADQSGRFRVSLMPLTIEDVFYHFSVTLNVLPDEEGNDELSSAQVIDQGPIPSGFYDRAITLRSESGEAAEVFEIFLEAGEALSLATTAPGVSLVLKNRLGVELAVSSPDRMGLSAFVDSFKSAAARSVFVAVRNVAGEDYDLVAAISDSENLLVPPSIGHHTYDLARPYSNIRSGLMEGVLLESSGFSRDTYRLALDENQALVFSASGAGVSYLIESPERIPLCEGMVVDGAEIAWTTQGAGDYFLTFLTSSVEMVSYTAGLSSNVVFESDLDNSSGQNAHAILYGLSRVGDCSRMVTLHGTVGLDDGGADQEPNNSIGEARDLEGSEWSLRASPDIQDATLIPHTSLRGSGDDSRDIYRFVSRVPNSRLICDIDRSVSLDSYLRVLDSEGELVEEDDDSDTSEGAGGSSSSDDSFIDINLESSGVYFVEVGRSGGNGNLREGDGYELHLSLEHHALNLVADSDPHDYYRIDLVSGELLTLALPQSHPKFEVFEYGNSLEVTESGRSDLPQIFRYLAEKEVSLIVKLSGDLVSPYDLLVLRNAELESFSHATPGSAMPVDEDAPTLGWISPGPPDFYRVNFSSGQDRTIKISQIDQGPAPSSLKIAVYNESLELVATSLASPNNELSLELPLELGNNFFCAITQEFDAPGLYLLQVGDHSLVCPEILPGGTFAIDWEVIPNQAYQVEFSPNLRDWTLIPEVLSSATSLLEWVDSGPPRTNSAPRSDKSDRFYRLVKAKE